MSPLLGQPRPPAEPAAGYEISVNNSPVAYSRALSVDSAGEAARIAHLALRTQLKIVALDVFLFQQQVQQQQQQQEQTAKAVTTATATPSTSTLK